MTTQQAADFLSISRPTLVRLLESGEVPFDQPGRHRRVRLEDLVEYQARFRAQRKAALRDLARANLDVKVQVAVPGDVKRMSEFSGE